MGDNKNFTFRRAKIEDIHLIHGMIQELASFEKVDDGPELTKDDLIRDSGLTGGPELCHMYVLDLHKENETVVIGYAICFLSYSTWVGKSYFLEDIFVRSEYRGIGAGARIFREVAAIAKELGAKRVDFHVLGWNPARKFYGQMGAIDMTEKEKWHYYRVEEAQICELAKNL